MDHMKPSGAPDCWGKKYQDGEEECAQCRFQDSCKQEMLYQTIRPNQPVLRNYAPSSPPRLNYPQSSTMVVPLPPKPYFAPPASSIPTPVPPRIMPSAALPVQQPQTSYYQQSTGFSLPNSTAAQNPLTPWHRPGASSPAYYFTQYPGESTGTRLVKNVLLRALEAIFAELMQYFRHWTWPPRK